MKDLFLKLPKSIIITQSIFLIFGVFFIPKYLIFLFHLGIFKYYSIPDKFLDFNSFLYLTTSHYFLVHILAYLSVFFILFSIIGSISFSILKEINHNHKSTSKSSNTFFLIYIFEVYFLVFLCCVGIIDIITFLAFTITMSIIVFLRLLSSSHNVYLNFLLFTYSTIVFLLLLITILTSYLIGKGEDYASNYKSINSYDVVNISGENHAILQYYKNNIITKKNS